jgi:HKD family nuclease
MDIKFLGQGFNPEIDDSVGSHLIRLLAERRFESLTWFSAFASEPGIRGLSHHLESVKRHFKSMTIIVGVDQKGTSKEALEALLDLNLNAFIFYQPSNAIFHPKIYLFEGIAETVLIVGSSNLTLL